MILEAVISPLMLNNYLRYVVGHVPVYQCYEFQ